MSEYKEGHVRRVRVLYFEEDIKRAEARGAAKARQDTLRPVFAQLYPELTRSQLCDRYKRSQEEYDQFCREFGVTPRI